MKIETVDKLQKLLDGLTKNGSELASEFLEDIKSKPLEMRPIGEVDILRCISNELCANAESALNIGILLVKLRNMSITKN